jgi:hypothetical protein
MTIRKEMDATGASKIPLASAETASSPAAGPPRGGFDLAALRLPQNFIDTAGVQKRSAIRLGKPPKHSFFRVRAGSEFQFPTRLLEFGESKDAYLVAVGLAESIGTLLRAVVLRIYITREGVVGIWPLAIPDPLRPNRWHTSALDLALASEQHWVRMAANQGVGAYDFVAALGDLKDPTWPAASFEETIREAFKDRFIEEADHAVLRALRGEAQ